MKPHTLSRSLAVAFISAALTVTAAVAQEAKPFEPRVGQPGKDVIWVPTPQALVDRMLDMARVTVDDIVMDLGSGDGRTVITAAKRVIVWEILMHTSDEMRDAGIAPMTCPPGGTLAGQGIAVSSIAA